MEKPIIPLSRQTIRLKGRFLDQGKIIEYSWKEICERFAVNGVIRIHKKDFPLIPRTGRFTHFNLEVSHHQPGAVYLLIAITAPGSYEEDKKEILPLLDLSESIKARCFSVKEFVPYSEISDVDFKFSLINIKSVAELKNAMLWRYRQSLPAISEKNLLSRGVSITTLDLL